MVCKMKRKIMAFLVVIVVFGGLFLFAQANKQAWRDFFVMTGSIEKVASDIQQLYNLMIHIESEKVNIVDNPQRLAELKKILDQHPDYSVQWMQTRLNKLKTLRQWLENNGYIQN